MQITNSFCELDTSLQDEDIFPVAFLGSEEILHLENDPIREILRLDISFSSFAAINEVLDNELFDSGEPERYFSL